MDLVRTVKTQLNDNIQTMADYTVTEAQIENLVLRAAGAALRPCGGTISPNQRVLCFSPYHGRLPQRLACVGAAGSRDRVGAPTLAPPG